LLAETIDMSDSQDFGHGCDDDDCRDEIVIKDYQSSPFRFVVVGNGELRDTVIGLRIF
jgi:hypothetical protein